MARVALTVAGGLLTAIVSYATERTFGLFVIGLIIACLIAYGGFRLWQALNKGSLSLGQWLTRLSRAGDPRAVQVAAFIERGFAT
jgi:hypothetical protein